MQTTLEKMFHLVRIRFRVRTASVLNATLIVRKIENILQFVIQNTSPGAIKLRKTTFLPEKRNLSKNRLHVSRLRQTPTFRQKYLFGINTSFVWDKSVIPFEHNIFGHFRRDRNSLSFYDR